MTDDRRLSTSDLVNAAERAEGRNVRVADERNERIDRNGIDERHETHRPDIDEKHEPLFAAADSEGYRTRWSAIQTGFVDEPRKAVEEADALVAEVVRRLAEGFAQERQRLEAEWERNDQVSTEDLRQSMRRYRSFFDRLLNI